MNYAQRNKRNFRSTWRFLACATVGLSLFALAVHWYLGQGRLSPPIFAGGIVPAARLSQKVACPPAGEGTLAIFGLGQSNAGNHGVQSVEYTATNPNVFEYWQGDCYLATSPSLGATGVGESLWPLLGNLLIANGAATNVIFSVFAVDGASIKRFVDPRDLQPYWVSTLQGVLTKYKLTYVVWLQGEADFARQTAPEAYIAMFNRVAGLIRSQNTAASILISRQTYCANVSQWRRDNPIAQAQLALANASPTVRMGPDADQILGNDGGLRWDGCHPSHLGYQKWALAWAIFIGQLEVAK